MNKNNIYTLEDRGVLYLQGEDVLDFLQNLITNDVYKVKENYSCFASLLTPQGKYLFDFIIIKHKNGIISTVQAYWDSLPGFCLKIIAEKGYVRFGPYFEINSHFSQGGKKGVESEIPRDKIDDSFRQGLFAQDLHFINSVRKNEKPGVPACLLDDAYKTNKLIEEILTDNF